MDSVTLVATKEPQGEEKPPVPVPDPPGGIPGPSPSSTYLRGGKSIRRGVGHGVRKQPRNKQNPVTPVEQEQVARMAVAGITQGMIAHRLRLSVGTVSEILATPHVQEFMLQCREAIRTITLAGIAQTQGKALEWLEKTVEDKDAKSFDAVTRGVYSLEKTAASASGETRPNVQIAVVNQQTESEEVQALIRALAAP